MWSKERKLSSYLTWTVTLWRKWEVERKESQEHRQDPNDLRAYANSCPWISKKWLSATDRRTLCSRWKRVHLFRNRRERERERASLEISWLTSFSAHSLEYVWLKIWSYVDRFCPISVVSQSSVSECTLDTNSSLLSRSVVVLDKQYDLVFGVDVARCSARNRIVRDAQAHLPVMAILSSASYDFFFSPSFVRSPISELVIDKSWHIIAIWSLFCFSLSDSIFFVPWVCTILRISLARQTFPHDDQQYSSSTEQRQSTSSQRSSPANMSVQNGSTRRVRRGQIIARPSFCQRTVSWVSRIDDWRRFSHTDCLRRRCDR